MATLNNEQIKAIVNEAYKQATGTETIDNIDLSAFSDVGSDSVTGLREKFTKALIGVVTKNWFTDSSYRSQYRDVFFEDSERFGAIVQAISVEAPEVQDNSAWNDFVSGTSKVGQYTVYLPVVHSKYYTKSESWALPITITGEQWDTASRNMSELSGFVSYILMVVDNKIVEHMENMNMLNRNNFIAEKIQYAESVGAKGVHVVDLVKMYALETGKNAYTVAQAMNDADFLRFASMKLKEYKGYMGKQTSVFNTEGIVRFTPSDRLVVQLNDKFVNAIESVALSTTFHDEMVALPNFERVPYWQSIGDTTFNAVTSINVTTASGKGAGASAADVTVNRSGIVGLMCDKWAIIHTIRSNRVASQHFEIENLTHYEYQHRDSYMNNLTMNAIVFVLNDYAA